MSYDFTRTATGIVAKWQFHDIPTIWVEGPSDIFFYPPALRGMRYRIEPFYGCKNATALIDGLVKDNLPYIVILDGDYNILSPKRSVHRRVLILKRYSFENYLWHKDSLNYACTRHAQCGEQSDVMGTEMLRLEHHLKQVLQSAVELDLASASCNPAPKILPDSIDSLLSNSIDPDIDPKKISAYLDSASQSIPAEKITEAKLKLQKFLDSRNFHEVLKGHLILGIMHKMFSKKATELKGKPIGIRQDVFIQIISDAVWAIASEYDYRNLRSRLRKQLKACIEHPEMAALASS